VTDLDRRYTYLAKTFDAPALDDNQFAEVMTASVLPVWRALHEAGLVTAVQVLRKDGDIDLQTSSTPVRDWGYFALLELSPDVAVDTVLVAEHDGQVTVANLARSGVSYLSCEVLERPARAGTAIPLPSPHWTSPPAHHQAAIEYIQIPPGYWEEYRAFMRDYMGPVGARLVRLGHSFQIQILERTRVVHRDDSLPAWNRIHILWGDFEDQRNGFVSHTNEAVQALVGPQHDVHSVLNATNGYRVKPRMSRNRLLTSLCLDRAVPAPRAHR
jgi:hypothetical protein